MRSLNVSLMMILGGLGCALKALAYDPSCINQPCHSDLINLAQADAIYHKLSSRPDPESVFYTLDVRHAQALRVKFSSLSNFHHAQISLAVLERQGLLMLANNSSFDLDNLMRFYVCYATAAKISSNNLPYNHPIKVKLSDFKGVYSGSLFQALVANNALADTKPAKQGLLSHDWFAHSAIKNDFDIALSDLIYYSLNEGDASATSILLDKFLLGEHNLELFLKSKSVALATLHQDKSLAFRYELSAYDNARLLSELINDKSLSIELKDMMLQAMRFAPHAQGSLAEGIKKSIAGRTDLYSRFGELKIFDLNCFRNNQEASSLAYIEFLGKPYIISIQVQGLVKLPQEQAQELLEQLGLVIFEHILKDH